MQNNTMLKIKSAKALLRDEIKNVIANITTEVRERQSHAVFEKLLELPQYKNSKNVSIYLSTEDEINTIPILKDMFKNNKHVFIPKYEKKNMEMVELFSMDDYKTLPLTKWNIKQPKSNEKRDNCFESGGLDLIILPGVAFTNDGKRLGHGMGYYDEFLTLCFNRQQNRPYLIGIAFNEQIKKDIPTTEKDVILDSVLTEKLNII